MSRTAVYPGTFDPVTCGHVDLCMRALEMFDEIIIGVADNPDKAPFFDINERLQMIQHVFVDQPRIKVRPFSGLLIDFAREYNSKIIIRGLRAISDFEFEVQLAGMNRCLAEEIETVFLTAAERYKFVSSSLVREIARLGGDVSGFLNKNTETQLKQKLLRIHEKEH